MKTPIRPLITAALLAFGSAAAQAAAPVAPPAPLSPPSPPSPPSHSDWHSRGGDDYDDAGSTIDERRPLKADAKVRIANVAGSVQVSAWDKNEAYVTGELGHGASSLDISGSDGNLEIVVKTPKNSRNVSGTDLRVMLPVNAVLSIDAVSADVIVQGIKGKVAAATVSGELTLSLASDEVEARTVSGDVVLKSPAKVCSVNTVSGDVRVTGPSGRLKLETVSGDAELVGGVFSDLSLKSISGDYNVEAALTGDGRLTGETLSGEMRVRLPQATSALVSLHTFSGEVRSAFGGSSAPDEERRERKEFKIGDGRARVDLSSFSGDIRLEKR